MYFKQTADSDTVSTCHVSSGQLVTDKKDSAILYNSFNYRSAIFFTTKQFFAS